MQCQCSPAATAEVKALTFPSKAPASPLHCTVTAPITVILVYASERQELKCLWEGTEAQLLRILWAAVS